MQHRVAADARASPADAPRGGSNHQGGFQRHEQNRRGGKAPASFNPRASSFESNRQSPSPSLLTAPTPRGSGPEYNLLTPGFNDPLHLHDQLAERCRMLEMQCNSLRAQLAAQQHAQQAHQVRAAQRHAHAVAQAQSEKRSKSDSSVASSWRLSPNAFPPKGLQYDTDYYNAQAAVTNKYGNDMQPQANLSLTRTMSTPSNREHGVPQDMHDNRPIYGATSAYSLPGQSVNDLVLRSMLPAFAGSQQAMSAWIRRFKTRQVELTRDDTAPFGVGRRLGGGGIGVVQETLLDGIPLALKRSWPRRLTDAHLNEIKILGRITEKPHRHIVELVGSYIHRLRSSYELGLLIWPVAHCDLKAFFYELDILREYRMRYKDTVVSHRNDDVESASETLSDLLAIEPKPVTFAFASALEKIAQRRLCRSFGCIAEAVAYLHLHGIRHRDLKPSQILLSPQGLWLADFGWSKDMSDYTESSAIEDENMTTKYQSPERANKQTCRKTEDIFGLGCIFTEMMFYLKKSQDETRPWLQKGWSFQANLGQVRKILRGLFDNESSHLVELSQLVSRMLSFEANERPSIDDVLQALSGSHTTVPSKGFPPDTFFGSCCLTNYRLHQHQEFDKHPPNEADKPEIQKTKPGQPLSLNVSTCTYCKVARAKCSPPTRPWPGEKCSRCREKNLPCSALISRPEFASTSVVAVASAANQTPSDAPSPISRGTPQAQSSVPDSSAPDSNSGSIPCNIASCHAVFTGPNRRADRVAHLAEAHGWHSRS